MFYFRYWCAFKNQFKIRMAVCIRVVNLFYFFQTLALFGDTCIISLIANRLFMTTSKFKLDLFLHIWISFPHDSDILHHSIYFTHSLQIIPSRPFALTNNIKHLRFLNITVTLNSLLVKSIDFQFSLIFCYSL